MKAFAGNTKWYQEGMDLRDYFAAKVIQAMYPIHKDASYEIMCDYAYKLADAMMKAREQ